MNSEFINSSQEIKNTKRNTTKILYIIDVFQTPFAGTEGQVLKLISNLDPERFQAELLILRPSRWTNNEAFSVPTQILNIGSIRSPKSWWTLTKVAKQYRDSGVKIAHIYFNDGSVLCPPIFALFGIKTIISRRDMGYWYNKAYRLLLPITGKFISHAIVNANAVARVTQAVEKIPDHKITTIYNGFDCESRAATNEQLAAFKGDAPLLGLVANIRPIKRINDAIEALSKLPQNSVKLVVIGAGDTTPLKSLVTKRNLDDRVWFMGAQKDVSSLMQYIDVGLLCSESEGLSNTLLEYQWHGIPVVCSDVGGNPEAIKHAETGYLYEVGNVSKLANHINAMIEDKRLRGKLASNASTRARSIFSIAQMIEQHQSLYQSLISD